MRVLVTGGRGKVGAASAVALRTAGHRVVVTDLSPATYGPAPAGTLPYYRADLTDFGDAIGVVAQSRAEAIVHCAGIPDPSHDPPAVIFRNNVVAMFNIAEAAARTGVSRVVYTSSETVLGFITAERPFLPDYLPVDEEHPRRPQDAYALSKAIGEDILDALVRRSSITAVSIRPSLVLSSTEYPVVIPMLQAIPGPSFNHWSYVDVEDLADLIVLTVEAEIEGHEVVYAAQPDNVMARSLADLVSDAFPNGGPPLRALDRDDASGVSTVKARERFGWRPLRSWRDGVT